MIVVIILMGIAAGLVVPRLLVNDRRVATTSVEELSGLLSVVAQRNALGNQRLALVYSKTTGVVDIQVLRTTGEDSRRAKPRWTSDPLIKPATLNKLQLVEAVFDGAKAETRGWRLDLVPAQTRPNIELLVRTEAGITPPMSWRIELLPYAGVANVTEVTSSSSSRPGTGLRSIDLDAQGQGDSPW